MATTSKSYYAQMDSVLDTARYHYSNIVNVIKDIQKGVPDSVACRNHGITISEFRKEVYNRKLFTKDLEPVDDKTLLFVHPDFKIWSEILGIELTESSIEQIPPDIHETLESIFNDLDNRISTAIQLRYYHHETFSNIGKEIGNITPERARQVVSRAFHKLQCNTEVITRLTYGDWALKVIRNKQERYRNEILRKQANDIQVQSDTSPKDYLYLSVDSLDLSCRAKNALARANVKTIGEILTMIKDGNLNELRNVGYNTENEIRDKVLKFTSSFVNYLRELDKYEKQINEFDLDNFVKGVSNNL